MQVVIQLWESDIITVCRQAKALRGNPSMNLLITISRLINGWCHNMDFVFLQCFTFTRCAFSLIYLEDIWVLWHWRSSQRCEICLFSSTFHMRRGKRALLQTMWPHSHTVCIFVLIYKRSIKVHIHSSPQWTTESLMLNRAGRTSLLVQILFVAPSGILMKQHSLNRSSQKSQSQTIHFCQQNHAASTR